MAIFRPFAYNTGTTIPGTIQIGNLAIGVDNLDYYNMTQIKKLPKDDVIKTFDLECGVMSNPITYKGTDGIQRVAVYSAIGWLPGGFVGGSCPAANNGDEMGYKGTGKLHIYKLQ